MKNKIRSNNSLQSKLKSQSDCPDPETQVAIIRNNIALLVAEYPVEQITFWLECLEAEKKAEKRKQQLLLQARQLQLESGEPLATGFEDADYMEDDELLIQGILNDDLNQEIIQDVVNYIESSPKKSSEKKKNVKKKKNRNRDKEKKEEVKNENDNQEYYYYKNGGKYLKCKQKEDNLRKQNKYKLFDTKTIESNHALLVSTPDCPSNSDLTLQQRLHPWFRTAESLESPLSIDSATLFFNVAAFEVRDRCVRFRLPHLPFWLGTRLEEPQLSPEKLEALQFDLLIQTLSLLRHKTVVNTLQIYDEYLTTVKKMSRITNYDDIFYYRNNCPFYNQGNLKARFPSKEQKYRNYVKSIIEYQSMIIDFKNNPLVANGRCLFDFNQYLKEKVKISDKTFSSFINGDLGRTYANLEAILSRTDNNFRYSFNYQYSDLKIAEFPLYLKQCKETNKIPLMRGFVYVFNVSRNDERRDEKGVFILDLKVEAFIGPYELSLLLNWYLETYEEEYGKLSKEYVKIYEALIEKVYRLETKVDRVRYDSKYFGYEIQN